MANRRYLPSQLPDVRPHPDNYSVARRTPRPQAGAFAFTDTTNHMPRYCVDCGTITATGNRCPRHAATHHATRRSVYSSKRWQHVRRAAMDAAGYRCAACGGYPTPDDPLTAHHADYADPYDPSSIVVLHRSCHGKQHGGQRSVA